MKNKQELLSEIQEGLHTGIITYADLNPLIVAYQPQPIESHSDRPLNKPDKQSAVDVMFYIAGVVLFSAIMSIIVQSWDDGSAAVYALLSAGFGVALWLIAYYLIKSPLQNDIRKGLINSLLLTGSLSIIAGGYIAANEAVGVTDEANFIPSAIMLAILGAIHLGFDRVIKKDFVLLMGLLLCVAAFPALLFGFLQDSDAPMDAWAVILIITSALLAYATRIIAKAHPDRQKIRSSFDSFAAFLALASMYASSFGDYGILWLGILIAGVFGIFYLSIITQKKDLLGNASFFLVLTLITISFKYFSGFGVTTSLILAALGLLASAAIASSINKKYFKTNVFKQTV